MFFFKCGGSNGGGESQISNFLQTQVGKEECDILHADWDEDALSFLFSGLGLAESEVLNTQCQVFVLTRA